MADPKSDSQSFGFNRPEDDAAASGAGEPDPGAVKKATEAEVKQFVTPLKSFEQQVGEHVLRALAAPETVAVVTAVVVGPDGQQRIVSAALDPNMMQQVQQMFGEAAEQREEEVPCLGFHCYVERKTDAKKATTKKSRGSKKK